MSDPLKAILLALPFAIGVRAGLALFPAPRPAHACLDELARAEAVALAGELAEAEGVYRAELEHVAGETALAVESNLAAVIFEQGRDEEAESLWQDCLARGFEPARLHLGILYRETGRLEESLSCLRSAVGDPDQLHELADTLAEMGRHEEELVIRAEIGAADVADLWNLVAAAVAAGVEPRSRFWELVPMTAPGWPLYTLTLRVLADTLPHDLARRLLDEADAP